MSTAVGRADSTYRSRGVRIHGVIHPYGIAPDGEDGADGAVGGRDDAVRIHGVIHP